MTTASLNNLLSSANAIGACAPAEGEDWIKASTAVALLSAASGEGITRPVTPCDSEWAAAVATQVKAAGGPDVQCPAAGMPPNAQTNGDPSTPKAVSPPAGGTVGANVGAGGAAGGFLWWPVVAAVAGVSVTALAIFFIVAAYRRRDRRRVVASATATAGPTASGVPAWQLSAERTAAAAGAAEADRAALARAMRGSRLGWIAEPVPPAVQLPADGGPCPRSGATIPKKKKKKSKKKIVQAKDAPPPAVGTVGDFASSLEGNAAAGSSRAKLTWVATSAPPQQSVATLMPTPQLSPSAGGPSGPPRARLFKRSDAQGGERNI